MSLIILFVLALLVATGIMIACLRDLWACIMATGIYSFLSAGWMLLLDAPDVAFTEAAVGSGVSTVLLLTTISLTGCKVRSGGYKRPVAALIVVSVTGAALVYGTLDMPEFGDPNSPIQVYPSPSFVDKSQHDMHGLPNVVTSVLASYRGYDTLGETTVILTAGLSVLLVLRGERTKPPQSISASQTTVAPSGNETI